jgi:tetratricopeptide (TPR) repeat protein
MRRVPLVVVTALLGAPPLVAQSTPRRPKLPADADTLDAQAYYEWADRPDVDWRKAQDGFYWAWRLAPYETGYLYSMYRMIWYRQTPEWRVGYDTGDPYVLKSRDARQLDSLYAEVLVRNPFPYVKTPCLLQEQRLDQRKNPGWAGLLYYETGCYDLANAALALALKRDPGLLIAHVYRARGFFYQGEYDSALVQLNVLLDSLRARELTSLVQTYNSKAMFEYMVGTVEVARQHRDSARAAFQRALTEDLGFYPARAALGRLAFALNDYSSAKAEYEQAVELKGDDGVLRHDYAVTLLRAGDYAAAETQFREAIRLEPYWALPHYNLAAALATQGENDEAVTEYEAFIVRCPRRLDELARDARGAIAKLQARQP